LKINEKYIKGLGKRIEISTSKIRKIRVIRKKRKEKAFRTLCSGSYPHSKGLNFSRNSFSFFSFIMKEKSHKINNKSIRNKIFVKNIKIFLLNLLIGN
jgi:hypothetical protein